MADQGPILVAKSEDDKSRLVSQLHRENVPAESSKYIPVDLMWFVGTSTIMFDLKKIADFIASYLDGRLYDQIGAMKQAGASLYGLCLELDNGRRSNTNMLCGGKDHQWTWDQFDDAVLDVEHFGGVRIIESYDPSQTAARIAKVYRWTGKDTFSAWQAPVKIEAYNNFKYRDPEHPQGLIFFDETFRGQVGALMHLPGAGLVTANGLRENHSFMDILGITEEGLLEANQRWNAFRGIGPKTIKAWNAWIRA